MLFSKTCEYGLQAIIYIAYMDKKVSLTEISENQDLPNHYLSKILQLLVKAKLLTSTKGPSGGFQLGKVKKHILLAHVIDAIDGIDVLDRCGLGLRLCDDSSPCAIHHEFKPNRDAITSLMYTKTLEDIVSDIESGKCIMIL